MKHMFTCQVYYQELIYLKNMLTNTKKKFQKLKLNQRNKLYVLFGLVSLFDHCTMSTSVAPRASYPSMVHTKCIT